jgi:hypothetical protein
VEAILAIVEAVVIVETNRVLVEAVVIVETVRVEIVETETVQVEEAQAATEATKTKKLLSKRMNPFHSLLLTIQLQANN